MNLRSLLYTFSTKQVSLNKRQLFVITTFFYLLSLKINFISLLLVVFLFGLLYPQNWTLIRRLIFGFIAFLVINILVSYLFFYLHIPLYPLLLESLYSITAGIMLLRKKKTIPITPFISITELFNLLVPTAIFAFFFIGTLHYHTGLRIPILTEGDSAQHFTMTKLAIDHKSLLYGVRYYEGTPVASQVTYPPGFYINASILYNSLLNHPSPIQFARLIDLFYLFNIIIVCLSVYLIILLIEIHDDKETSALKNFLLIPFLFFFTFGYMLLYEYISGFSAQIFTILFFLVFVYSLIELPAKRKLFSISILLALNFVVAASWYVMLPVTIAMSIYYIYKNFSLFGMLAGIIAIPLSIIPMYYDFLKRFLDHTLTSDFVATSGINAIDYDLLIKLFAIFVIYLFLFRNFKKNFYLTITIIVSAIYSFGVLVLETYLSGGASYYYYKTLHYVIILLSIITACVIIQIVKLITRFLPKTLQLCFTLSASLLLLYFLFISYGSTYTSLYFHGNLKIAVNEENMMIILASNQKYANYEILPFSTNFLVHLWSQGFFPNISHFESDEGNWKIATSSDTVTTSELINSYVRTRKDTRPILFVDFSCYAKTENNLPIIATLSAEKKIEIYPPECNVLPPTSTPTQY